MESLIGKTLGNYRIESVIGIGGMGQVFRAVHIHLAREAAIKVLIRQSPSPGEERITASRNEAQPLRI